MMPDEQKNVLVADDDEAILEVLDLMLDTAGYHVTTVLRGEEVLELKNDLPDLIILDISMAGIDGRDICRHLKNQSFTKHIPVIMVSANKDIKAIATQAGAEDFICKPFEMDDLLQKAAYWLSVHELQKAGV